MRYLYKANAGTGNDPTNKADEADEELVAYAPGRLDFFRAGSDEIWAHDSHGWLIEAKSGVALAHRTGEMYYGAIDGERLYRVSTEGALGSLDETGAPAGVTAGAAHDSATGPQRSASRPARTRR